MFDAAAAEIALWMVPLMTFSQGRTGPQLPCQDQEFGECKIINAAQMQRLQADALRKQSL